MKKLIVAAMALSTLFFVGCGGDDDDNGPPPDTTITVTADTTAAPATPLVYNDPVWNSVQATTISIAGGTPLPVGPTKSPMGPSKALVVPASVNLQAIKRGGRLYLRFQWDDSDYSMQRDNWLLDEIENFNFSPRYGYIHEDQIFVMFEGAPGGGWDTWNWRVLTTGQVNLAEGMTYDSDTLDSDDGGKVTALLNKVGTDNRRPIYIHEDKAGFTGDVLYLQETIPAHEGVGAPGWTTEHTVPGWVIDSTIHQQLAVTPESRWDIEAVHVYDVGIGTPNRYTLVLARDLQGFPNDDLDMTEESRLKTRIGVFDDQMDITQTGTGRAFSADFWLALP